MEDRNRLSNVGIYNRVKQLIFLALVIILGVIITTAAEAQDFHRAKRRHFKTRYRTQIAQAKRECDILHKKSIMLQKSSQTASRHKVKYKPQAEVDSPANQKSEVVLAIR
jgi:hypothetical protein